jgi:hypothetical protein
MAFNVASVLLVFYHRVSVIVAFYQKPEKDYPKSSNYCRVG